MSVEILKRERVGNGWVRFTGAVNGVKVGVRLPISYLDSVSDRIADADVKEALQDEAERLRNPEGGAYAR